MADLKLRNSSDVSLVEVRDCALCQPYLPCVFSSGCPAPLTAVWLVWWQDLITLPHLHEPAILHSLWERFNHGDIYTFTGPILIAVNPFKRLPLYTEEKLMTYYEHGLLATQGRWVHIHPPSGRGVGGAWHACE